MDPLTSAQINQYKEYFKRINIEQYGTGVLLDALNEGKDTTSAFWADDSSDQEEETLLGPSSVSINTDNVWKKIWQDLEKEIKAWEKTHPEARGKYVVAINTKSEDGQPAITVAGKDEVLDLIPESEREESSSLISDNPVQIFNPDNLDVRALTPAGVTELESLVSAFLQKNQGVFQYLSTR